MIFAMSSSLVSSCQAGSAKARGLGSMAAAPGPSPAPVVPWHTTHRALKYFSASAAGPPAGAAGAVCVEGASTRTGSCWGGASSCLSLHPTNAVTPSATTILVNLDMCDDVPPARDRRRTALSRSLAIPLGWYRFFPQGHSCDGRPAPANRAFALGASHGAVDG